MTWPPIWLLRLPLPTWQTHFAPSAVDPVHLLSVSTPELLIWVSSPKKTVESPTSNYPERRKVAGPSLALFQPIVSGARHFTQKAAARAQYAIDSPDDSNGGPLKRSFVFGFEKAPQKFTTGTPISLRVARGDFVLRRCSFGQILAGTVRDSEKRSLGVMRFDERVHAPSMHSPAT